jgi:hypothetical protein
MRRGCPLVRPAPPVRLALAFALALAAGSVSACNRGEPPVMTGIDGAVSPLPPPSARSSTRTAAPAGPAAPTQTTQPARSPLPTEPDAGAPSSVANADHALDAADAGPDPGTLPQTRDKPSGKDAAFEARIEALFRGVVADDPELAMPGFFPLTAYEQVKAVGNPAGDWRRRLVAAYKRDVHALHKRLGDHPEGAKLVRVEVPDERMRWVEPDEEYNKLGYWRVFGTRVVYAIDGKERSFDVSSLISWRGAWYVVHLTGFK